MPVEPNPYDRPDLLDLRKGQEDPLVLYLVVRESLNMSAGKIASQVGHVMGMFGGRCEQLRRLRDAGEQLDPHYAANLKITDEWLATSYRKVTLRADDKEWERLKVDFWCFVAKDAGLTEVEPGSETVMAIWPMLKSARPKYMQRLQGLK